MTKILITKVTTQPDDVLIVSGFVDGESVEAQGWQSRLTNHFDEDAYLPPDKHGNIHRHAKAKPRKLTSDEARVYFEELLLANSPATTSPTHKPTTSVASLIKSVKLDKAPQN